jgi:hypothetical protein
MNEDNGPAARQPPNQRLFLFGPASAVPADSRAGGGISFALSPPEDAVCHMRKSDT